MHRLGITNLWLVLDNTSGSEKSHTSTTWTSASDVRWQQRQAAGAFRLESSLAKDSLDIFLLGSQDTEQRLLRGNSRPFAGWQVEHGVPVPASALVVEQPAKNSWAATIWTWKRAGAAARFDGTPQMTQWTDASNWEMQLPGEVGAVALRRKGNILRLHSGRGADETLELMAPSPTSVLRTRKCAASSWLRPRDITHFLPIWRSAKRLRICSLGSSYFSRFSSLYTNESTGRVSKL